MAKVYELKYDMPFKDINNDQFDIEIWQYVEEGTIQQLIPILADVNPFSVSMSGLNSKLEPVRGSGCQINMISETNLQYLEFFTADMMEYQIRAYKNSNLFWTGYLDSELYSEPFNAISNYPISFSGTDGFALLDRMYYLQEDGSKYTELSTQFSILKIILERLKLPIEKTFVKFSTTISAITIPNDLSLLNYTYVMNENFYNEDGEPSTLREVLESILKPYGAFIIQNNGNYYITDTPTIASNSGSNFAVWDGILSGVGFYTTTLNLNHGDLSTIGFAASDQNLNIIAGVNKQVINYSPYRIIDIIDYNAEEDFSDEIGSVTRGTYQYEWKETTYSTSKTWNKYNNGKFCKLEGTAVENSQTDYYLCIEDYGLTTDSLNPIHKSFSCKLPLLPFIPSSSHKLKIEMDVLPRLSDNLGAPLSEQIKCVNITARLKVGNKYYWYNDTYSQSNPNYYYNWYDSSNTAFNIGIANKDGSTSSQFAPLDGEWTDYKWNNFVQILRDDFLLVFDNTTHSGGNIEFEIYGYRCYDFDNAIVSTVKDVRIKNIKFTVIKSDNSEVEDADVEYVGYMNKMYSAEGSSIDLISGTNTTTFPMEKGGLIYMDSNFRYKYIKNWTRNGVTDIIENLLLRSYVGNYENRTYELSATLNLINDFYGYLTYNSQLSGKKFMITSYENNYADATSKVTLQEVFPDSLTINKSF